MATDCIIRLFDCSIRVYRTIWQPVAWASKQSPTLTMPLCMPAWYAVLTHHGHAMLTGVAI